MSEATAPPYPDSVLVRPSVARGGDLPPTYEDSTNPNSMPPTYDELFGEFQRVEDPKGLVHFLAKAFGVIIGTVAAAVLLALLNIIPLGMIVLGSVNLRRCPVEHYIPIWLIVSGVFSLVKSATNFFYRARRQRSGQPPSAADVSPNPFDGLLSCFLLVWFIVGSVWVYSVYDEVQYVSPSDTDFCDQFTFVFSFVFVTLGYILLALTMCCFCCCCCCICFRPKRQQLP